MTGCINLYVGATVPAASSASVASGLLIWKKENDKSSWPGTRLAAVGQLAPQDGGLRYLNAPRLSPPSNSWLWSPPSVSTVTDPWDSLLSTDKHATACGSQDGKQ